MGNEKNNNISLLRILSMFMVVMLHVIGNGGVRGGFERRSINYVIAVAVELINYSAVNLFALISGYLMYDRKKGYLEKIISFFLKTMLFSVLVSFIGIIFFDKISCVDFKSVIYSSIPIYSSLWYIKQ